MVFWNDWVTPDTETIRRLFLALWPNDTLRRQLAAVARRCSRHPVPVANLHMTLVFLGRSSEMQRQCYCQAVSDIRLESFEMQLDYLGAWARQGIQWLGCSSVPAVLPELVRELGSALAECEFETDKRSFVPHVTLSRKEKNPRPRAGLEPVRWRVREFVLVESRPVAQGVEYTVLQSWPLQNPG